MTAIKTVIDEKGVYSSLGSSDTDTGVQRNYGGLVEKPEFVGGNVSLTLTSSVLAVTASVNVLCTLPSSPSSGQRYDILKATTAAMTVSVTGSNGAHTITGSSGTIVLLSTPGKSTLQFVGSPANMWIIK